MIRVIAFVIALACCVGLISGTHNALTDAGDDLVFTEEVLFGDPSVLDGRVISSSIECGDHMTWNTTCTFGPEDYFDTEFVFTQAKRMTDSTNNRNELEVYTTAGFGASTSGSFELRNTGCGDMIRAVAAVTPDGEERQMNLKLADYADCHPLDFGLSYSSEQYYCEEHVDITSHFFDQWNDDEMDFETYVQDVLSLCYLDFCELFRFPVMDDEIVSVTVQKDSAGGISGMDYNVLNAPEIRIVTALNDSGAYCIPVYVKSGASSEALQGEYAYGMGIYFIPWKMVPDQYRSIDDDIRRQVVTLDVANARNIYPLPETTIVYGLEIDKETGTVWMLSLEEGAYVLTQLKENQILRRLEVTDAEPNDGYYYPTWHCRENLMIVEACGKIALVDLTGEPEVDFVVPLGETRDGFWDFSNNTGGIWYDGETLILAGSRYYDDNSLSVLAYGANGPLYWGEFGCSVFDGNDPGCSPYIQNSESRVRIE